MNMSKPPRVFMVTWTGSGFGDDVKGASYSGGDSASEPQEVRIFLRATAAVPERVTRPCRPYHIGA